MKDCILAQHFLAHVLQTTGGFVFGFMHVATLQKIYYLLLTYVNVFSLLYSVTRNFSRSCLRWVCAVPFASYTAPGKDVPICKTFLRSTCGKDSMDSSFLLLSANCPLWGICLLISSIYLFLNF